LNELQYPVAVPNLSFCMTVMVVIGCVFCLGFSRSGDATLRVKPMLHLGLPPLGFHSDFLEFLRHSIERLGKPHCSTRSKGSCEINGCNRLCPWFRVSLI
jgi:hypothetical protein